MKTWSGLYTPLITPFKSNALDESGLGRLIEIQKKAGVNGLVFLGTTGEAMLLSDAERNEVLKIASSQCKDIPWMVGTGYPTARETLEKTEIAAKYGATFALVCPPYYVRPTQQGLINHYLEVATHSPLPIIIYNNPSRAAVTIEKSTLLKCSEHPNIIGLKESDKDLDTFHSLAMHFKTHRSDFWMIAGDDSTLLSFFEKGARGAISPLGNLFPTDLLEFTNACLSGNFINAKQLIKHLQPVIDALNLETNPIALKFAMSLRELPSGNPRTPLTPLSISSQSKVREAIDGFMTYTGALI